jgi:DNA sulfur modification protein DndD
VLIHGENMRGKTSFMNAIKWCLYGKAVDRLGQQIPVHRMLSYDALDAEDFHMSVTLEYDHDSKHCVLERHVQADRRPTSERGLRSTLQLRRDGYFEVAEEVPEIIGEMLHEDIARFFLFDGEMLSHYEVLLSEPGRDAELVRDSIEQIIGLPALQMMVGDLEDLRRDAERRVLQQMRASEKQETMVAEAQQISNEIDAIERDLAEMQHQLAEVERERAQLRQQLDGITEIRADVRDMERLEESVSNKEDEQQRVLIECQQIISASWWMPVAARAEEILDHLTRDAAEQQMRVGQIAVLQHDVESLRGAMAGPYCPVCEQPITRDASHQIGERLARAEAELNTLARGTDQPAHTMDLVDRLRPFAQRQSLARFREKENLHRRLGIEIRRNRRELESVRERLRAHDVREIRKAQERDERCVVQLESIRKDIEEKKRYHNDLERYLSNRYQEIHKAPGVDPRTVAEKGAYESLHRIFTRAVDRFRDSVRRDVEREATELFRQLTTEAGYDRLAINEQYGLSIVDGEERTILDRSAGAEQVVALSLVGALNRCAVREGPVIMDTPFGRLDVGHRKNILEFVPSMSSQVILLVQSGEFDRQRDLKHLAGRVGREYWLVRDGSPIRSRFQSSAPGV